MRPRPTALLLCLLAFLPRLRAVDNSVLYWNEEALDATRLSRNPPPMSSLVLATYHAAIFDTVNGFEHRYQGWLVNERAPAGADCDAAVAGAARLVLLTMWSEATNPHDVQVAFDAALAGIPDGPAKTAGIAWGEHVARLILKSRSTSGFNKPIPGKYASKDPGKWRPTPAAFRPPTLPFWGHVRPFVMTSPSQFRAPPPYPISSKEYAAELAYVNRVGPRDNAERSDYETFCTPFWSDDLGTSTPPGHWDMVAQLVARRQHLSVLESARLFALLNLAEADGAIACWDTKFYYNTWRPETALRDAGETAANPGAPSNPGFIPNLASPSFPSYTSGHSTFSGAGARILALFTGSDDFPFDLTSDGLPGVVHHFSTFSEAQREAGMSRVWGGIHTMSDNIQGQKMGVAITDYVWAHALLPASPPPPPSSAAAGLPTGGKS